MKRTFLFIIILITLSIVGIIIIQVQWFSNLLLVQEDKFSYKLDKAAFEVTQDISKETSSGPMLRLQRRPDINLLPNNLNYDASRAPSTADRFSEKEIYAKLRTALDDAGLKNLQFEFGIITNEADYNTVEMQSKNFQEESMDTLHYHRSIAPIVPESGTDMEGLMAYEHLVIIIPNFKTQVWESLIWMIIGALLFTLILIAAFYLTVKTLLNQRKLSKIKSDFINNMTHELKTPLATISLAVDALKNEKVQADKEKTQYFNSIIKEENKRMNKHVETILQAAVMDRQELKLNIKPLSVHQVIKTVLGNFNLQLSEKGAKAALLLNAANDIINADEVHFTNLINNLIDNAVKYSKENLAIKITTHSTSRYIIIKVEDNGIGMNKETVKRIFEKFYRAHTGNIHNVKGFGLGMSYVKTVVDALKAKIRVESTLGKGSSFILDIPLAKDEKDDF